MLNMNLDKLLALKKNFCGRKIAVIGDLMIDGYFWGVVNRISPEAPVSVVEVGEEFFRFGGAANVALNILKLNAIPIPIGVVGKDNNADIFNSLLFEAGIKKDGIIIDEERPTTCKTRVIAANQHVVRIDKEKKHPISTEVQQKIITFLTENISDIDAIILQDYNKGVLTKELIQEIIIISNNNKKIVAVDPKFDNFFEYKNVTVFKPNKKETESVLGIKIDTPEKLKFAGNELLSRLNSKYVLITLGPEGIVLFEKDKPLIQIPTKARKVADVSGAGDTVISTLTLALCAGADIQEAAYLANYAGGLVCEEVGIIPIEIEKLFEQIQSEMK
ncbi:MAG: D-glycero-beta-D-manno-heptose-7-phosphate kinase [Ignavibacteriales bacterium]|nr:D-glycero-beta-D-manno-heptose-7-phosphate kinase [Ignavibacteriales bacterium]